MKRNNFRHNKEKHKMKKLVLVQPQEKALQVCKENIIAGWVETLKTNNNFGIGTDCAGNLYEIHLNYNDDYYIDEDGIGVWPNGICC